MSRKSAETDAYIAKAPDYARPILKKARALFHKAAPGIIESKKWGAPAFECDGLVAMMAAFKQHVGISFCQQRHLTHRAAKAFSGRFASIDDLPKDADFIACVREAVALNQPGNKPKRPARAARPAAPPADFSSALAKNAKARAAFDTFPPSHRRELIEWITTAKREETRNRRLEKAIAWISAGKPHNWKYM